MAKQNKVAVNLAQDFTDAEKAQARSNIGAGTANVHIITTDYSTPTLGDVTFAELESAVNNNEEVLMKVGMNSAAVYYKLAVVSATEYRFESYTASGLSTLTITRATKAKTFNTEVIGLPTVTRYDASWGGSWHSIRQLEDDISSGTTLITVTLSTPISLSANKRYMIIPEGVVGNVEQTKTVSHTVNNTYSLDMWLSDSSQSIMYGKTAVRFAWAEICNQNSQTLGEYPLVGGTYRAAFNSYPVIIEPEVNLTLDTLSIINSGNISWGFNRSNPAILAFNQRVLGIDVMEIQ